MKYPLLPAFLLLSLALQAQLPALGGGGKTWAVIAGISDYKEEEISDLQYAHRDAEVFYEFLRSPAGGNVPEEQIQLLTNEKATFAAFGSALYWLIEKAGEGDRVYIYFAGHGDVENRVIGNLGFLLTADSPPHSYFAGAFPLTNLQYFVTTLSVQNKARVILIADACHSGKLAGSAVSGAQLTNQNLQQQYANEVKILACGPDEVSQEGEQWGGGRGAFSYHLIEGLQGLADEDGNYQVNLFEIRRYLEDKVSRETAPNSQYPLTFGDRNASLSLVDPGVLAQLVKQKSERPSGMVSVAMRGKEPTAQVDSLGTELFRAFQLAIEEKRLLSPENNSAWYYYTRLAPRPEFSAMDGTLRRNLAVALQDDAQRAINAYLDTDPGEMARRWEEGPQAYAHIPVFLSRADELLGEGHYMHDALQSKRLYFEAMLLRMEGSAENSETLARQALEKVEEAIALEPKGAHLYNELGLIRSALGESAQEIQAYRRAHELAPSWAMPVYNMGITQQELGMPDSAKFWMDLAIELKPEFPAAHIQLGNLWDLAGNLPEAEAAFLKSIELYKAEAGEGRTDPRGYYALGNIYLKTGRPELAREMYEQTILLDSQHPYANYGLGIALKRTGHYEEAVRAFQRNLEITPGYLEPYYSISILYAEEKANEEALQWLEKALEKGYSRKDKIMEEESFSALRDTERFRELMEKYFQK